MCVVILNDTQLAHSFSGLAESFGMFLICMLHAYFNSNRVA
jgi:hypothetical protein